MSRTLLLMPATDKWQLSDRQLIVIVCPLLIIHAVCLSHSQKTREVLLFLVGGGERGPRSVFYPSVLFVSQNLLQMESKISAPETDPFGFSSKVVTLTFPVAYAILPTPSLLVFSPDPFLIGALEKTAHITVLFWSREVSTASSAKWRSNKIKISL